MITTIAPITITAITHKTKKVSFVRPAELISVAISSALIYPPNF